MEFEMSDYSVWGRLSSRYGTKDPYEIGDAYAKEMGIDQTPILSSSARPEIHGGYSPKTNTIYADSTDAKEELTKTLIHEYAHKGDLDKSFYDSRTQPWHHSMTPNFDKYFPEALAQQSIIEEGNKPSQSFLSEHPELNSIIPLSSNYLANPWDMKGQK